MCTAEKLGLLEAAEAAYMADVTRCRAGCFSEYLRWRPMSERVAFRSEKHVLHLAQCRVGCTEMFDGDDWPEGVLNTLWLSLFRAYAAVGNSKASEYASTLRFRGLHDADVNSYYDVNAEQCEQGMCGVVSCGWGI